MAMREYGTPLRLRLAPGDEDRIARLSSGFGTVSGIAREALRRGLDDLEREQRERWATTGPDSADHQPAAA
jgi:hypothetical protein